MTPSMSSTRSSRNTPERTNPSYSSRRRGRIPSRGACSGVGSIKETIPPLAPSGLTLGANDHGGRGGQGRCGGAGVGLGGGGGRVAIVIGGTGLPGRGRRGSGVGVLGQGGAGGRPGGAGLVHDQPVGDAG